MNDSRPGGRRQWPVDVAVTLAIWAYFTLGYLLLFAPRHLAALAIRDRRVREIAFQWINHRFYRGFFRLLVRITPGLTLRIDPAVREIRSSVVVANHRSYLDPLLLIAVFPVHKTIVKPVFFRVPIFGSVIAQSGYLPAETDPRTESLLIDGIAGMRDYLDGGGNLFVFPEGTRLTGDDDSPVGFLHRGAFKIARRRRAPVRVVSIRGTDRIFAPGRFWFRTGAPVTISVEPAGTVSPDAWGAQPLPEIIESVRAALSGPPGPSTPAGPDRPGPSSEAP